MSVEEKQARSVFVGNIPHGTPEDQMKEIFSIIGTVLSFRIVLDRETGNPKGYGFAEYADADMALVAIRNLNGFNLNGRTLRVDKASSQADELRLLHQQTPVVPQQYESTQPANITPDKVPEVIQRTIINLPPEQVVDLMKQMQTVIKEYPTEARNILIQNPQLAYAMLQSLVTMDLISPAEASSMLHKRPDIQSLNLLNESNNMGAPIVPNFPTSLPVTNQNFGLTTPLVPQPTMPIVPPPASLHAHIAQMNFPLGTAGLPGVPNPAAFPTTSAVSQTEQSKAQLLMQILQLTDAQIAQLPPEQRANIIMLREQMQQSGMGSKFQKKKK